MEPDNWKGELDDFPDVSILFWEYFGNKNDLSPVYLV